MYQYEVTTASSRPCGTRRRQRRQPRALLLAVCCSLMGPTSALQLGMVASHPGAFRSRSRVVVPSSPPARRRPSSSPSSPLTSPGGALGGGDITSSLISQLAVVALKLRLADHAAVTCDANAAPTDLLLKGQVGPVTVRGREWASSLGLTCRAIEATVQRCHLDIGSIVSRRKLVLTTPAEGNALIALDGDDFANFIKHPLMKPPSLPSSDETFQFLKENVNIDTSGGGTVTFYGEYMERRWKCTLRRGRSGGSMGAVVSVLPVDVDDIRRADVAKMSAQLTEVMSKFFNEMVFELDGTFLSFKDMMVTAKGDSPSVMLALSIKVKKFPSRGLEF